jgi:hypothetical protein
LTSLAFEKLLTSVPGYRVARRPAEPRVHTEDRALYVTMAEVELGETV